MLEKILEIHENEKNMKNRVYVVLNFGKSEMVTMDIFSFDPRFHPDASFSSNLKVQIQFYRDHEIKHEFDLTTKKLRSKI